MLSLVENEWDHRISVGVKEGLEDCIRIDGSGCSIEKDI